VWLGRRVRGWFGLGGPLVPNGQSTVALRGLCRARKDLVAHRVRVANQLREHLNRVFPGAVGLFTKLDSPISLRFLARFDCQDRADWLTPRRLESWLKSMGYCGRTDPAAVYARLSAAPRGLCRRRRCAGSDHASPSGRPGSLVEQITMLSDQIGQQLEAHADSHIFTSLPHAGTVRAARLLAEIGDCRARFPTPESLACPAGVAPSTRQSGKMRSVGFRWACDKQLRDAVCDFADGSRRANPWAAQLYGRSRARGHDHPHAVRVLARAWVYIIWACWQANTAL
jgi:transposase